jgi:flagellar assembly protein FliH
MSSSSDTSRGRVLRGTATTRLRTVPFTDDLAGDRPLLGLDPAIVQRAVEEGRRAGFDAGYGAGLVAAATEAADREAHRQLAVDQALAALTDAAADLGRRQVTALTDIEDEVLEAALAIAQAVLEREISLATDPGRDAILRALALAPEGDAVVRMHPADVEMLGEVDCGRDLTVVADASVEPGGCLLELGACRIDAQISSAVSRVRKALQ